ncbi:hypothetical protein GCM10010347_43320 [Streptomyces cirratus]|uniref:Cyclic nucleotide-binding domain-containing protein n=1 Tax=Streptomyces cirratus TaxID=68187 RepID=A0ABQ3F0D2_9ACTN|nr:PPOX class F420-dependent oxidoreductase [Streptomyces cirratus]GHB68483.1 hypothetical protein GCM10010347_43320 [Streptomyces cirratus]
MTQGPVPRPLSDEALSDLLGKQQFGTLDGHVQRNPLVALHVRGDDVWSFAVAEGQAEVSDSTTVPGDAVGQEVLGMIPQAAKPEDESAFLKQLVAERRVVIRLRVDRLYGTVLGIDD